jgi:cyclophilin family peptidyl-prolyl cis-trans isomerase
MASVGIDTNGSQFYISLKPTYYMNGRCVVFGRLIEGEEVIKSIEKSFTFRGMPANDIIISSCGILK